MTRKEKLAVVEVYLKGLGARDFSTVPFAPDVTYESPLTPRLSGKEAIDFLKGLFPIIKGVEIKQHVVDRAHQLAVATTAGHHDPHPITKMVNEID